MQRSLAERARGLERTNRLLLGLAAISFVVAVLVVILMIGREEHAERRARERVAEALRSVRQEFERRTPVVIPPQPDLPPMPDQPPAAGGAAVGG
jgi:type VI protein secretion system component VasK